MNKKLLFGLMSLAALAACTNDDFDSQQQVAEGTSPIQFEVINNNASMRATMDGNTVEWSAKDGDLFTLYHGAAYATPAATSGYQNATYKANAVDGGVATLTTPSVILPGSAIMVWPVDTTFSITAADNLTIKIPQIQGGKVNGKEIIQNQIPYVSDLIQIQNYAAYTETAPATAYNTAGKDRKYSVYMRPMASQLNLKADYAGTDAQIAQLYEGGSDGLTGEDAVNKIEVSSVDLLTTTTKFTTKIPLKFAAPTPTQGTNWATKAPNNAWTQVTDFNVAGITPADQVAKLTTKHLFAGNTGGKFLILPQANIGGTGVTEGAVVVNTNYGKVIVAPTTFVTNTGKYSGAEIADAWYRITNTAVPAATAAAYSENAATAAETSGEFAGKYKTTADVMHGMAQVIDAFSANRVTTTTSTVYDGPTGAAGTRYVKVLLGYLDMTDLHIKTDKQLRDAAKVWKKMNLSDVTVYLDGDATGKFEMTQKTIEVINTINASVPGKDFKVMPCTVGGEACTDIVVTGGGDIKDMTFIRVNGTAKANVVLKANENWKWNGTVKVAPAANTGIAQFINKGTLTNNETKVLAITDNTTPATQLFSIPLINDGTWNVTAGTLRVQFNVTNNGTVNISKGAQYRQDGQDVLAKKTTFANEATDIPSRFNGDDSKIGKVENKGVFATIGGADINNYGLIEHADKDAKTYITTNQLGGAFGTVFGATNKMGRINLPYSNKEEDNISVSAALAQGFVSVTVSTTDAPANGILDASVVGNKVNYVIVNGGIQKISAVSAQVDYLEINQPNTEIEWTVTGVTNYAGLMVLSPVNIKLNTTINATVTYLGSDMYVGGTFNNTTTNWAGYYGDTSGNVATKYITF